MSEKPRHTSNHNELEHWIEDEGALAAGPEAGVYPPWVETGISDDATEAGLAHPRADVVTLAGRLTHLGHGVGDPLVLAVRWTLTLIDRVGTYAREDDLEATARAGAEIWEGSETVTAIGSGTETGTESRGTGISR